MGPYMTLIVPSSFYRIDSRAPENQIIKINKTQIQLKYFFGARGVKFLEKRRENVQIFQALI
jgi:hypothetical protein